MPSSTMKTPWLATLAWLAAAMAAFVLAWATPDDAQLQLLTQPLSFDLLGE